MKPLTAPFAQSSGHIIWHIGAQSACGVILGIREAFLEEVVSNMTSGGRAEIWAEDTAGAEVASWTSTDCRPTIQGPDTCWVLAEQTSLAPYPSGDLGVVSWNRLY